MDENYKERFYNQKTLCPKYVLHWHKLLFLRCITQSFHIQTAYETRIRMCVHGEKICMSKATHGQGSLVIGLLRVVLVSLICRPLEGPTPRSALQLLHDLHDDGPRACQNQVAHGPVVYMQHVEPIDRDDKLADLKARRRKSIRYGSWLFTVLSQRHCVVLTGHAILKIPSHSQLATAIQSFPRNYTFPGRQYNGESICCRDFTKLDLNPHLGTY